MPKATLYEYRSLMFLENNIRISWQVFSMKTKAETTPMQQASDEQLRLCILPPDSGHHPASGGFVDDICHAGASSGVMPIAL